MKMEYTSTAGARKTTMWVGKGLRFRGGVDSITAPVKISDFGFRIEAVQRRAPGLVGIRGGGQNTHEVFLLPEFEDWK